MPKLIKLNTAQNLMLAEFVWNFDDTMVNAAGALTDFKAVGTPAFDIIALPPNSIIVGGQLIVETAYATSTAASVSLGDSSSAARYLGVTDLKTGARTAVTPTGFVNANGLSLRATFNITVAAATAGRVRAQIQYMVADRANEVNRAA